MKRPAIALLFIVLLAACGASAREKALTSSLTALDVAADTVVEVSNKRQEQIVETATSRDEAHAKVDAFRAERAPVIEDIARAYKAIATAALGDGAIAGVITTVHDAIKHAEEWSK
jgi:hypothetical protein